MAKQTFQVGIDFIANVNDLQSKIKNVTGDIAKMGSSSGGTQVQKQFDKLTQSVQNLQTKAQQPITSQSEFNKLVSELGRAESAYDGLIGSLERMRSMSNAQKLELLPAGEQAKIQKAAQALNAYDAEAKKAAASSDKLRAANERVAEAQNKMTGAKTAWKNATKDYEEAKSKLEQVRAASLQVSEAQKNLDNAMSKGAGEQEIAQLKLTLEQAKTAAQNLGVEFQEGISPVNTMKAAVQTLNSEVTKLSTRKTDLGKDFETAKAKVKSLKADLTTLEGELGKTGSNIQLEQAFERLKAKAKELGVDLKGIDDSGQIDELKSRLIQLESQGINKADASIGKLSGSLKGELKSNLNSTRQGLDQAANSFDKFNQQAQEVEQLKSQLGYFFSLTNSVYLLRSALQSAFETVKELDAVMTETAVVTTNSVGDMWEKLPEYAAAASVLGSSIKDVYAATTLYYQQGLAANEAMTVGIETMKMARIANMDAAEATQAMTAALRGFKMEVNEVNALRVNDVYSNLAAITAADTEQIATAMSKTASIAASANMEFETTAALLAQIIETTQEAPETAGTALKTIIARFSEVKELQNQGKTAGEDSEGESIDVNKIDKALSSVGISMDAFFAGTEGLDSVLMRLAEKWDTLDFTTQRYIATMAAGSRQQSRFIAMMSDYARTTELVSAANNSAGASQKQFDKTMESLEAKLNRLKVAWDQFTMGIADNQLIKTGIDLLTGLLETINKLLNGLPGLTKSFASLALVFVALRAGGALLNKALAGISGIVAKSFAEAGVVASKTAEVAGQTAGTKMALGTAKGANNPAAQAALFKSYNLLIFKLQSTLPPVQIKMGSNPAAYKAITAEMNSLKIQMGQVASTAGIHSKQWDELHLKYLQLKKDQAAAVSGYVLEGAGMDQLTFQQQQLLGAKIKEGTITKTQLALLGPEAAARVANALAAGAEEEEIEELVWAKTTEKTIQDGGLLGLFAEIGLRMMGKTAIEGQTVSTWGLVKAKLAEAVAWVKANSAMLTGALLIAAIVAGIVLLVVGITKFVTAFKGMRDGTAELEKINSQLAELTEQTQQASEEINNIADAKSGLQEMQTTFEGLTKGTAEWKQKLVEINSEVMSLMDTYPELAQYVYKGENGELKIGEEGWEKVNEAAYQRYNLAVQSSTGLQTQKIAQQQEIEFEKYESDYIQAKTSWRETLDSSEGKAAAMYAGGGVGLAAGAIAGTKIGAGIGTAWGPLGTIIGAGVGVLAGAITGLGATYLGPMLGFDEEYYQKQATGGLTEKQFTDFAAAAAEKGITSEDTSELKQLFIDMDYEQYASWDKVSAKIEELGDDFDSLAASAFELEQAQSAYVDSFVSQGLTAAGLEQHEQAEQVAEITALGYEDLDQQIEQKVEDMDKSLDEEQLAEYAALSGKTLDQVNKEIKDGVVSEDTIKTVLATNEVQQEMQKQMKETSVVLGALANSGEEVQSLFNILSREGKDIKMADIEEFMKAQYNTEYEGLKIEDVHDDATQKSMIENYLSERGTSLKELGLDQGEDWKIIWENLSIGAESFKEASEHAQAYGFADTIKSLGAKNYNDFSNKVKSFESTSNVEEREAFAESLKKIMPDSVEDQEAFMTALNGLDWTNAAEIDSFSDKLKELGILFSGSESDLAHFEDQIQQLANATYSFSSEEVKTSLIELQNILSEITGSYKNSITKEQYEGLTDDMKERFAYNAATGTYIYSATDGKTMKQAFEEENDQKIQGTEFFTAATKKAESERQQAGIEGKETEATTRTNETGFEVMYGSDSSVYRFTGAPDQVGFLSEDQYNLGGWYMNEKTGEMKRFTEAEYEDTKDDEGNTDWADLGSYASSEEFFGYTGTSQEIIQRDILGSELPTLDYMQHYRDSGTDQDVTGYLVQDGFATDSKFANYLLTYVQTHSEEGTVYGDLSPEEQEKMWNGAMSEYLDTFDDDTWKGLFGEQEVTKEDVKEMYSYGALNNTITTGGVYTSESKSILEQIKSGQVIGEDQYNPDEVGTFQLLTLDQALELYKNTFGEEYVVSDSTVASDVVSAIGERYITEDEREANEEEYQKYLEQLPELLTGLSSEGLLEMANQDLPQEVRDKLTEALDTRIQEGASEGEVSHNKKLLEGLGLTEEQIKSLTLAAQDNEKAFKKMFEQFSDFSQTIKKEKRHLSEYRTAMTQLAQVMTNVLGGEITYDYLMQYQDLVELMLQGGENGFQAYVQLTNNKLVDDLVNQYGMARDEAENLVNYLNGLKTGATFELSVIGDSEVLGVLNQLNGETVLLEDQMEAVNKWAEWVGVEVAWEPVTVYTDDEFPGQIFQTPKDLKNPKQLTVWRSKGVVSADRRGLYNSTFNKSGGGGGQYENSYDKLHNILEEINDTLRIRERLERQYQRLLDRNLATAQDLAKLSRDSISTYQLEIEKQKAVIAGRKQQITEEMAANPNLHKFVYTEKDADGNDSIRINWEEFEALKNSDTGEKADEYYSKIQEWLQSIYDAQAAIEEAEDAIYEELLQGKDEFLDLESQVKDAIVNQRQKEIDKLSEINESINDTNSKILDSLQTQIDDYRQNRDNEKTEEELSDKQRKLAYLQQDTSGANASEILELQKELEEEQEDYTDTLIDQKISDLQEQNDKAAEQRQQQIDLMQAQLDQYSESEDIWWEVSQLIKDGTSATEGLLSGSELERLLQSDSAFQGMSKIQKMDWMNTTNNQIANALKWLSEGAVSTAIGEGKSVTFTNKQGKEITGTVGKNGEVVTDDGSIYTDVDMDAYGNLTSSQTAEEAIAERDKRLKEEADRLAAEEEAKNFPMGRPSKIQGEVKYKESGSNVKTLQWALHNILDKNGKPYLAGDPDGVFGSKTYAALKRFQNDNGISEFDKNGNRKFGDKTREWFRLNQYKTGGLADFTGPAWLDGTKSRPEYILNADQTKAFFTLVDVLSGLNPKDSQTSQNTGDTNYDIDINVESIGNDYDVEQLANKVKSLINEDARYRNNNAINLMR